MKPKVAIDFTDSEGGDCIVRLVFNDTNQIDELICTLYEMRQDLEKQIECEKHRRCEKRKRRMDNRKVKDTFKELEAILDSQNKENKSNISFYKFLNDLIESLENRYK